MRTDRLQTLADGIFAIAATLLVLSLPVPAPVSFAIYAGRTVRSSATSEAVGGLVPAALCATTALGALLTRRWDGRRAVLIGVLVLAAGVLVTLGGIHAGTGALVFAGSAVAGLGFGPAFAGTFRTLTPLADADARAGLLAAVYVVSYLAFAVPAVIAGLAVSHWGLRDSASGYAAVVVLLALAAAAVTVRQPSVHAKASISHARR